MIRDGSRSTLVSRAAFWSSAGRARCQLFDGHQEAEAASAPVREARRQAHAIAGRASLVICDRTHEERRSFGRNYHFMTTRHGSQSPLILSDEEQAELKALAGRRKTDGPSPGVEGPDRFGLCGWSPEQGGWRRSSAWSSHPGRLVMRASKRPSRAGSANLDRAISGVSA